MLDGIRNIKKLFTSKKIKPEQLETTKNDVPFYVFIHGAGQTRRSWNFIISKLRLNSQQYMCMEYNSDLPFYENLEYLTVALMTVPDNSAFVSHSLGGIYALHLYKLKPQKFSTSVSISTPFKGSSTADILKFLSPNTLLYRDVGCRAKPIIEAQAVKIDIPWTQIISIHGNSPWMAKPNDGIVTVKSQKHRTDVDQVEVYANHQEILACTEVVGIIKANTITKHNN